MKIVVIGTRGIPNIQGGIETHCEELFPRLVKLGCDITIVRRSCYIREDVVLKEYKGVKLHDLYAPRKKGFEAIFHTFCGVIYARKVHADIVHVHAVGPSIVVPFARLLGLKVVITHHGCDYNRAKWGKLAKGIIKTGERWGVKYANKVIVISQFIKDIVENEYQRKDSFLIYNGVTIHQKSTQTDYLKHLGVIPNRYVLAVGRFVKEKGFEGLIKAFTDANIQGYQLVISGDADQPGPYDKMLKALAKKNNVVLTGFIKDEELNQIYTNARLFVLPSFHEGLPISLLEAMSYDDDVLVSDIIANVEVNLPTEDYFSCGNWEELTARLQDKLSTNNDKKKYDLSRYQWDHIAEQTLEVYQSI
jgi:glycosyltransferase involved in cell wall biosynthesis